MKDSTVINLEEPSLLHTRTNQMFLDFSNYEIEVLHRHYDNDFVHIDNYFVFVNGRTYLLRRSGYLEKDYEYVVKLVDYTQDWIGFKLDGADVAFDTLLLEIESKKKGLSFDEVKSLKQDLMKTYTIYFRKKYDHDDAYDVMQSMS
nr:hypothetical protein [Moritella viscosa]